MLCFRACHEANVPWPATQHVVHNEVHLFAIVSISTWYAKVLQGLVYLSQANAHFSNIHMQVIRWNAQYSSLVAVCCLKS
jgi:hypothetical protein